MRLSIIAMLELLFGKRWKCRFYFIGETIFTGGGPLSAGDVDNDGEIDLYLNNRKTGSILWLNDGNFNFSNSGLINEACYSSDLVDIDNDNDLDIIHGRGHNSSGNTIYINQIKK